MKTYPKKYVFKDKSCDIKVFRSDDEVVVRFFNSEHEISLTEIGSPCFVQAGYGYMLFQIKGESTGLASGFIDDVFFDSEEMVYDAMDFIIEFCEREDSYVPSFFEWGKTGKFLEFNGEW